RSGVFSRQERRSCVGCAAFHRTTRRTHPVADPYLTGIMPVLQIPFLSSRLLDQVYDESLRREVDFCIGCGVHGLVIPALASEFMVLTDAERRQVVASTVDQAAGRVPVVANVAAPSSQAAVEFAHHAREVGAAAVMALPPYIRKPTIDGVMDY